LATLISSLSAIDLTHLIDSLFYSETPPEAYKALKKTWGRKSADRDSAARALLSVNTMSSTSAFEVLESSPGQAADVTKQFEALQSTTSDDLQSFPDSAKVLAKQASQVVLASQTEIERLRSKLAMESATRRKLLHEVQDLRGTIRVYCRPMTVSKGVSTISTPSQEVLLLHRERAGFREGPANNTPLSFAVDGILDSGMNQQEVYDEMEDVCLGALDGYNICVMSFGQSGSGKTYTIIGDVQYDEGKEPAVSIEDYGIHLRAAQQFFSVLKHRSERYEDVVTLNIVEVHNERLCDLLVGTETGEAKGLVEGARSSNRKRIDSHEGSFASQPTKLEIKTNHNGETVVHGLISVEVSSFDDVLRVWKECLGKRASRLSEQGVDLAQHESNSHVIGTLKVFSTNISTGVATQGKIQFVDLAASNVVPKRSTGDKKKVSTPEAMMAGVGNNQEWKFANKSMATLTEVVNARSQFQRSIPYRNSTITHLLSDSLEADTKIVVVACVSSDLKDLQETACTLRFAQKLRKIVVGKATKHTLTHA
jgi:kinesin family protein C2/C3